MFKRFSTNDNIFLAFNVANSPFHNKKLSPHLPYPILAVQTKLLGPYMLNLQMNTQCSFVQMER